MEQTFQPAAGTYQPVGVPAVAPRHPGMTQGISGIICAVISLLFFPPIFGLAGVVLGVLAIRKGERALGITAIVLSALLMLIGLGLAIYLNAHPELLESNSSMSGAVIEALFK